MLNQVVSKTLTRPALSDNTRRAYAGALGQLDAWLDRLILGQGFHLVVGRQWLVALHLT